MQSFPKNINFGGNIGLRISNQCLPRFRQTNWVRKGSLIQRCADYSSSGPERYIPKINPKFEERKALHEQKLMRRKLEEISQDGVPYNFKPRTVKLNNGNVEENIENKNFDSKGFRRLLNFEETPQNGVSSDSKAQIANMKSGDIEENLEKRKFDNKDLERNPTSDEIPQNGGSDHSKGNAVKPSSIFEEAEEFLDLEEEEHIDDPEILDENGNGQGDVKKHSRDIQDAAKVAIKTLARRACTARELRKKLLAKGFSPYVIQSVLTDFYIRGFVNDDLYAEAFARSKWSSSTWGPRRIKHTLHEKGVSDAVAAKAMKHVFEDDDSGEEMESSLGMSKSSVNHLFVQSSKQWMRSQDVPLDKRKARMTRWLQYRGFGWGVIKFILGKLESQNAHEDMRLLECKDNPFGKWPCKCLKEFY
ncbi:uncharacterized protein LOC113301664 isoform X2 [Papaver somniferum]|uniref:uncharacterized protein LOC113301664 isoform X2 n=1 Tax=Papaver somniferum TaxID=3469 RepID=UPI000E6FD51F|nr:uncharacterized protein LOC113301664 isoform X2 [Papaver somniferum]